MKDEELQRILNEYDPEELRVVALDGFIIYRKTGETNQWGEPEDVKLWQWNVEFDGPPYGALRTLFNEVGLEVE